ncbi:glycosyltransferase [Methylobacterium gnaphalii]|uniref:Glycosyltransferase 2-like domain-containing protein n=1 Tax=Methylobacterium gnaphalii TaxID=1010610 RepID=A0A512JRL1_9HYPH|nr:glycosyltransferase [Methylobacterium gnaphalii]GEP12579.1 hypothetical protein MGN01_44240 [Methylobacterium gnaphalii]GJD71520.1 Undecaprenyl-phosphate 4-deoxy-4-formamido-L-arabinose transferase [Methylobacterium gnaphalii]GLS51346.1 hypothetical protein GCM10007885_42030 [Methylobacterium gnaphalii]
MSSQPRTCIVTDEFVGINKKGGIGTCARALAEICQAAGEQVDVLITSPKTPIDIAILSQRFNVQFLSDQIFDTMSIVEASDDAAKAYKTYLYIRNRSFDTIHFNDWQGSGFYVAMAKIQGLIKGRIITHLHGSSAWVRRYNQNSPKLEDFEREDMERFQIENSDYVIAPSSYMLQWYEKEGVVLPKGERRQWILPQWLEYNNLHPGNLTTDSLAPETLREVVFFGRQERRKGIDIFVEAISRLPKTFKPTITFLGAFSQIDHEFTGAYILRKLIHYPGRIRFLPDLDQESALQYILRAQGAICVMPSLIENSPCVVGECFTIGVPFLSTDVGGTAELIDPDSRNLCLVQPTASSIADALQRVQAKGLPSLQSSLNPRHIIRAWKDSITIFSNSRENTCYARFKRGPTVSVCLTHYNRPKMLDRALKAIYRQDYEDIELIIIDDGSNFPEAIRYIDDLSVGSSRFPLKVIKSENRYLGAARNLGVKHATGEYVLFHDDDNISEPDEISTFVTAALNSGYDILTSQYYVYDDNKQRDPLADRNIRWFPIGIGGLYSIFHNKFGDANALFRKSAFEAIGGFTELRGVGLEDWELFLRAYYKGLKIGVVPEPLFTYRISSEGMLQQGNPVDNYDRLFAAVEASNGLLSADMLRYIRSNDIRAEQRARALRIVSPLPGGDLHRELIDCDPQSSAARIKLTELAFSLGRTDDAIDLALQTPSSRHRLLALDRERYGVLGIGAFRNYIEVPLAHDRTALLIKGWLLDQRNTATSIATAKLNKDEFECVAERRYPRPDVDLSRQIPHSSNSGVVALFRKSTKPRLSVRRMVARWKGITISSGISEGKLEVERKSGTRVTGHIDFATWCRIVPVELAGDERSSIQLIIEAPKPELVAISFAGSPFMFAADIEPGRARFSLPSKVFTPIALLEIAAPANDRIEIMY